MHRALPAPVAALALLVLALGLTGCVTSKKYRLAKEDTPPAQTLDWSVSVPPVALTLKSVIVIKGPGSWKREARWDEYVVKITNSGSQPVTVVSSELVDVLGQPQIPGADPWPLEKLSYTNWDKYGKTGLKLLAGAGAVVLYAGYTMSVAMTGFMGGATASAGAVALVNVIPVVALVDVTTVAIMNHNNKKAVQAEFDRRRLPLPLTVPGDGRVEGSFFFPMTPGPQRLVLKGTAGEAPLELGLDLKPLAGLHLKPEEKSQGLPR
jgi:hypothetical protein